jgi:hypothetical protein
MFLVWFFWLFVLIGGLFMGLASVRIILRDGVTLALALNALVYLGCAISAAPRLWRLWRQPPAQSH